MVNPKLKSFTTIIMVLSYPELDENCKLPELYLRTDADVGYVMDEGIEKDEEPKRKKKPKD